MECFYKRGFRLCSITSGVEVSFDNSVARSNGPQSDYLQPDRFLSQPEKNMFSITSAPLYPVVISGVSSNIVIKIKHVPRSSLELPHRVVVMVPLVDLEQLERTSSVRLYLPTYNNNISLCILKSSDVSWFQHTSLSPKFWPESPCLQQLHYRKE